MSHHPPSLPHSASVPPNPSFFAWLRHHALLFVGQIVGLISAIASFLYYVEGAYEKSKLDDKTKLEDLYRHLFVWSDCAHLVFIFLFISVLIYVLDDNERGHYHARKV